MISSHLRKAVAAAALMAVGTSAFAYVETFENLAGVGFTDPQGTFLDTALNGMQFGNAGLSNWFGSAETTQGAAFYEAQSGTNLAFTVPAGGFTITDAEAITSATDFQFEGAYFSGTAVGLSLVQIQITGFDRSDVQVFQTAMTDLPATDGNLFIASGYAGFDVAKLVISGPQGYYGMDDFTYNYAPIPEPATVAMMLAGLALVGGMARRSRAS